MHNALLIVVLIAGPLTAYVVVLMMPRWFFRSLHGHRMWRLRDAAVDDVFAEKLPRDHKAVQHLIACMDMILRERRLTLLDVYIVNRASKHADPGLSGATGPQGFDCPLDGLSVNERKRVEEYRENFMTLVVGSMLLGSWFGIAHVLRLAPAGIRAGMRQASLATRDGIRHRVEGLRSRFERDILISAREATDLAASNTRLGQNVANVYALRHNVAQSATRDPAASHEHPLATSHH